MRGGVKTAPSERRWQLDFRMVANSRAVGWRGVWHMDYRAGERE